MTGATLLLSFLGLLLVWLRAIQAQVKAGPQRKDEAHVRDHAGD